MSNTPKPAPAEIEVLFVDPWSKGPDHVGEVPSGAQFVGAWENDLGIDSLNEALFLVRDKRRDLLWSLTTHAEEFTKQNLAARATGDPHWVKSKVSCGCVAGDRRHGTEGEAAARLLHALAHARVHHESPQPPYLPGLLTRKELGDIVGTVNDELNCNAIMAAQRGHNAPIVKLARELGLDPRPAGHNSSAWIADCPRRSHSIMISPSLNEFGCGYCHRKGGPAELEAFAAYLLSLGGKL